MENNEREIKPQSIAGLNLMTIFIVVIVAHVLVLGGVSAYYHFKGAGNADTDLADGKTPKDAKVAADGSVTTDSPLPDGGQADKTAAAPAPAIEQTSPAETAPAPVAIAPSTPTGPVVTPSQMPAAPAPLVATEPTSAPPLEPESPPAPATTGLYVVKMHDTLEKIALHHHTTAAKLIARNGLRNEILHVGQRLVIPGKTAVAAAPAAAATSATLVRAALAPSPDEAVAAPAPASHHTYTVVKGDTLIKIAHKFKTTAKALMVANNITDPTKLSIGRKLTIPSHDVQATTTVAPAAPAATTPTPSAVEPPPAKTTAQLANFVQ